ncbi:4-coumarate--CoA ligase 1-like [Drosophila eugracilis]|uniref:4-coumarate--CoA ligase 1-like n=1 Tax=Drosophila eugracilis TaxID=29029 RepID=UPI001BDA112C|nr:4-coumarate--CoA ligase 1-like [Drosophila eugracilis]
MSGLTATFDEKERTWSGPKGENTIMDDDTSLGSIIFKAMPNWAKNMSQICDEDGISLTFEQTLRWSIRIAQFLKRKGLNHKDVIGIIAANSIYLAPLGIGCFFNGTPFQAMNPSLDEATTNELLSQTKPAIIFCDENVYEKIKSASRGWQPDIYTITGKVLGVPSIKVLLEPTGTEEMYQPEPLAEGCRQTVAILCSSGTTGFPKLIAISKVNFLIHDDRGVGIVLYTPSTLSWTTGILTLVLSITSGTTQIRSRKPYTAENVVRLVKKYKINVAYMAPEHLSSLISCPEVTSEAMESVQMLSYAGGYISLATLERAKKIFNKAIITSTYALTECGILARNFTNSNFSSAGRPFYNVKLRIVDEVGNNLAHNQVGEIYAHTGRPWNGYYGSQEATRSFQDPEGWFHTGDMGYFDSENFLYIVDRKKEVLKYQGLQYWTTEIEEVISELPQVRDVCVVGIYNEKVGDEAGALVVISHGSNITAKEIVNHVAKQLPASHKHLHAGVQFTEKLPANANGKTLRKAAREEFMAKKKLATG